MAFNAFQAVDMPDLLLHHKLLSHIDGLATTGALVGHTAAITGFGAGIRRGGRFGRLSASLLLFPLRGCVLQSAGSNQSLEMDMAVGLVVGFYKTSPI